MINGISHQHVLSYNSINTSRTGGSTARSFFNSLLGKSAFVSYRTKRVDENPSEAL